MNKIVFNRKIAESIFNDNALREELITVLNELIDAELMKDDSEADFDVIDAYSQALNELYDEKSVERVFRKLQTVEEFTNSVKDDKRFKLITRAFKITAAACAALALIIGANTVTKKATGYDVFEEMAKAFRNTFTSESVESSTTPTETTTEPPTDRANADVKEEETSVTETETDGETKTTERASETGKQITPKNPDLTEVLSPTDPPTEKETETTTRAPFTRPNEEETAPPVLIKLTGECSESFKRDYKVGEEADFSGLTIKALYDSGEERIIPIEQCSVKGFSTETSANRIVTVTYGDCSFSFLIRVK